MKKWFSNLKDVVSKKLAWLNIFRDLIINLNIVKGIALNLGHAPFGRRHLIMDGIDIVCNNWQDF